MSKPIKTQVKLQIEAGKATPAPPVGSTLGPHGINIPQFVKGFNDATAKDAGLIIPVVVTIYTDRTFDFELKTPPVAVLIKKERALLDASGSAVQIDDDAAIEQRLGGDNRKL